MAILHHHKLLVGLCLLVVQACANIGSLTPSLVMDTESTELFEPTPTETMEMSSTEDILTSSSSYVVSTSSSTPSEPHPTPSKLPHWTSTIRAVQTDCMFVEIANLTVNFTNQDYRNLSFTSKWLNITYTTYNDTFTGCPDTQVHRNGNKTHQLMRTYYNSSKDPVFFLLMDFQLDDNGKEWELSVLKHGWYDREKAIFTYENCGHMLRASTGLTYRCNNLTCIGHESAYPNIASSLQMEHVKIQAFLDGDKIPEMYVSCGQPAGDNHTVYIIVGLVVGITVLVALLVIVGSFAFKRYKYGPYSLLD